MTLIIYCSVLLKLFDRTRTYTTWNLWTYFNKTKEFVYCSKKKNNVSHSRKTCQIKFRKEKGKKIYEGETSSSARDAIIKAKILRLTLPLSFPLYIEYKNGNIILSLYKSCALFPATNSYPVTVRIGICKIASRLVLIHGSAISIRDVYIN